MPNHVQNIIYFKKMSSTKSSNHEDYEDLDIITIREILEEIKYDDKEEAGTTDLLGTIDFNKLIPMPDSLHIVSGGHQKEAIETYLSCINPANDDYGYEEKATASYYNSLLARIIGASGPFCREYNDKLSKEEVVKNIEEYFKGISGKHRWSKPSEYELTLLDLGKTAINNVINYGSLDWYDWSCKRWGTKWNSYSPWPWEENNCIGYSTAWSASHPVIKELSRKFPNVLFMHYWADEDFGMNTGMISYYKGKEFYAYIPNGGSKEACELAAEIQGIDLEEEYFYYQEKEDYIYLSDYFEISEEAYKTLVTKKRRLKARYFVKEKDEDGKVHYKFNNECDEYENNDFLKKVYSEIYNNGFEIDY